ncbi:LysR family transcriptional regulator [Pseudoalteromonas citrea]|uniref:LysR family transcriptional regulator n=1 Tax=Pseudoalteromonas citrea TaxID=43655 RepID=A0A5S3XMI8_9GAMM|nr:LysR family transcriptional regulator [Pseudoalteromonas citrea]TMP39181.1 LysR family transcriptional regulator [Pseudoalteromonas citrea]TMP57154.1 LysR family transcriptional regulator [Pseudoalteromonas citrea]
MISLDIEAIKAFIAISEHKSFTIAAEALGTTQASLSVKLKRLEEKLNVRLLERTPRKVTLSQVGQSFLPSAHRLIEANNDALSTLIAPKKQFKLGVGCHVFGPEIQKVLARLNDVDPLLQVELTVDSSRKLYEDCNNRLLDAIIIRSDDGRYDGDKLCPEHFGWYAAKNFFYDQQGPLPIANLKDHCGLRNVATQTLDSASIEWHEAFVGNNITAIITAISAGLAVGIFPHRAAPNDLIEVSNSLSLPPIPPSSVLIYTAIFDRQTRDTIKMIVDTFSECHEEFDLKEI